MIWCWRFENSRVWLKIMVLVTKAHIQLEERYTDLCVYFWLCEEWIYMRFTVPGIADTIATQSRDT